MNGGSMFTPFRGFALLILLAAPTWADYAAGKRAFDSGDYATAMKEWLPLALAGDADAQYGVAFSYSQGKGVAKNDVEAAKWYRLAAEHESAGAVCESSLPCLAQGQLALLYEHGGEGVPRDIEEALKWFRRAASQGEHTIQFLLALKYHTGEDVPKDSAEAAKWYRLAADGGDSEAQASLGAMYASGDGVPRDDKEALRWTQTRSGTRFKSGPI